MSGCPTCGYSGYARVSRGGRAYVKPSNQQWRAPGRGGIAAPVHPIRVYWIAKRTRKGRTYAPCPSCNSAPQYVQPHETFEQWMERLRILDASKRQRPYTGLNMHGAPGEQADRRKAKARRQKGRQSKARR